MEHILVTGGAGFVGSHLCDLLLGKGHKVTAIDNLITGSLDNIAHNTGNLNFKFIRHDITEPIQTNDTYDAILNFASPASPVDYQRYPIETLKVGSVGIQNMLDLARKNRAVFFQASTSEVYGDPLVHPQTEDYWGNVNPVGPRSMYDESKRFAEAMTVAYRDHYGLDVRIVRIFNTYGPRMRMDDGRVVPNLIYQALTGQPLTVYGDGSQTRSFCFVSDEIDGIYRLLQSGYTDPVNIGNPAEVTILQFAETIRRLTGAESEIIFEPLPKDDPLKRKPDITRAKRLLGWEPKVGLEEGLKRSIEYFSGRITRQSSVVK